MKNPSVHALALAGLLLAGSAAWALPGEKSGEKQAPTPQPRPAMREKIVIVEKDGKQHTFDSWGTLARRGYLGVGLTELSPELRTHFDVPEDAGVMVSSVEEGSPADKAGVKVGDIIASVDGKDVKSSWDVRSQIRELKEAEQVPLVVYRDGKAQNLSATITIRERPEFDLAPFVFQGDGEHEPMVFQLDPEKLQELRQLEGRRRAPMAIRPRSPREAELEKRLKELEKRLAELEKLLEKK
ncbi:MAG TPA: PDZ domain-containing protein [Thermoanaerobaculia bacterium]|nr:PDZ domain-containing protein [Thermoanaerobaculia bacterium]